MPSTVADILTVESDHSSSGNSVSKRTRRRKSSSLSDNLPLRVISSRSQKTLRARKDLNNCIIQDAVRRRLMGCQVLLSDVFSPGSQFEHLPMHIKEGSNAVQIHDVSESVTTEKHSLSGQNNQTLTQPHSYVTRRTNSRRTKSIKRQESLAENGSSNVNIVPENPHSIIHLDESCIGTKSIAVLADLTQTSSSNDIIVPVSKDAVDSQPHRITRRGKSLKVPNSNENTVVSRTALKRKSESVLPSQDAGVSPPKRSSGTKLPILEHSAEAACSKSSSNSLKDMPPGTDKQNINTGSSIIHLDQSCVSTKSIAEMEDLSKNDVIAPQAVATSKTRRVTRRMTMKATESNNNTIRSRKAILRKSDNIIKAQKTDVSLLSVLHDSTAAVSSEASSININAGTFSSKCSLDKLNNNAFKLLTVSIKRVALPLTEAELKRLKYEDSTRSDRVLQRPSSRIRWRPNSGIKVERGSLPKAKPKIVISSPIIEVPESPPVPDRNSMAHSYLAVSKIAPTAQSDGFKIPHPSLPQIIEHDNEENDDVYEFLSSSQNGGTTKSKKTTQKPKLKKVSAASVKNKRKATVAKPKAKPPKQVNPFGCDNKALVKVIKKLGGGPVKQPATVGYKINLELPKTPPVVASPVAEPQQLDNIELSYDDYLASVEVSRIRNPTVQRLKAGQPSLPLTSTPAYRSGTVSHLNVTASQTPASPWRVQDEITIPRTSYTHRTKEMLPSYESFATENNNIPVKTSAFVTERRKSPNVGPVLSTLPVPEYTPEPSMAEQQLDEGIVSDKDLREFEKMYLELKMTSEMSQKLIKAMRMSKKNPTTPQQKHTMQLACLKLKKWYDRSMNAFNRSMCIINNLQQTTEKSANRAMACPSPLSLEQQRTLNNFNSSTDHFRSMIDQLQSAINDSDVENRPPPTASFEAPDTEVQCDENGPVMKLNAVTKSKAPKDVVILPERGVNTKRNPLMPLNVVPLPQRTSPLISPLAKNPTIGPNNIRRELQYDKENESSKISDKQSQKVIESIPQTPAPELPEASIGSLVEINDETTHNDCANNDDDTACNSKHFSTEAIENTEKYFGFDGDDGVVETSAQVTLPMPLDISHETLQRRLQNMKQLLPKRPIFRKQPKQQNRSSGPTRFPATKLRVFGSPSKRPHTLREFVASTPRPAGSSTEQATVPSKSLQAFDMEAPDVSAIVPITETVTTVEQNDHGAQNNNGPDVVLFDTPDRPEWLNNSAHQRTYARNPRHKKKNIYLANLGLDDDSEDEENASPEELSSDSETKVAKRKKKANKRKAQRKQPVEETKNFKQFVENFNSMCEEVERYELIIE